MDNDNLNDIIGDDSILDNEPSEKGGIGSVIIILLIILVWLGIFAALIKFDVMGFGSDVMAPVIKDVPVLNKLLPEDAKVKDNNDIPYKSIAECATYIKQLENQIAGYQQEATDKDTKIADLQAEVSRLKQFENNQAEFENLKSQFYEEVVFGDKSLSYEEYIKYYESIDSENAAKLYQQAINKYVYSQEIQERAKYYSSMDPKAAAAIFCEMTGDLDIVKQLLESMSAESCGKILQAISDVDPIYAAKITKKLMPNE